MDIDINEAKNWTVEIRNDKIIELCEGLSEIKKYIANNESHKAIDALSEWYNRLSPLCIIPDTSDMFIECPFCHRETFKEGNFCRYCARKIRETCNCWVLKKPYNCGHVQCPGYGLNWELLQAEEFQEQGRSETRYKSDENFLKDWVCILKNFFENLRRLWR